jgi:hypothetical protein
LLVNIYPERKDFSFPAEPGKLKQMKSPRRRIPFPVFGKKPQIINVLLEDFDAPQVELGINLK